LGFGEYDLVAQALEDLHGCDPRLGEKRVVHAGEEEGDAHRDADHDRAHHFRQSGITLPP